jgi:hypothetical protein
MEKIIKEELSRQLGVSVDDLNGDDSLTADLHLKPNDITDFLVTLSRRGIDTSKIDFDEVDTINELVDSLE